MTKVAVGVRVKDTHSEKWATISSVREDGMFSVDWDEGTIGEYWWDESEWLFDQPNDPLGPIRTETVTVRRLEPGVYGRLSVQADTAPYVSIALTSPDGTEVIERYRRSFSAPELRELARVALEIAEYLDAQ
jgi:hypothetical protein